MICRRCLQRSAGLVTRASSTSQAGLVSAARQLSLKPVALTTRWYSSAPAPEAASASPEAPVLGTPLGNADTSASSKPTLSSCPPGTVLTGLNYFKNKTDPVALADDAYPEWLWTCLDASKKNDDAQEDAGDEFSKSKKQRKLAAKRQRAAEARLLAGGDMEALAPKIPLQQQSINLPVNEDATVEGAIAAAEAREELRKAMRKERKASIRETNYLKSM